MTRCQIAFTAAVLILAMLVNEVRINATSLHSQNSASTKAEEYIIVFVNDQGRENILKHSRTVLHQFRTIHAISAVVDSNGLKALRKDPNISHIERNTANLTRLGAFSATTISTLSFQNEQASFNFQMMKPFVMWNEGFTGTRVKVGVIDSGIAPHKELSVTGGVSTVSYTSSYTDDNGHGTFMAGIIAAKVDSGPDYTDPDTKKTMSLMGIAPDVKLYAIKALDQEGEGTLEDVMEGIEWAIENRMDIINLSFTTRVDSWLLHSMVNRAYNQGILVVGAAGNRGEVGSTAEPNTVDYPAKYDSVIAVSAIDQNKQRGSFSAYGPEVEVAAPGDDIVSSWLNNRYAKASGTSQAAAHVTGVLALLRQQYPAWPAAKLRALLHHLAEDLGSPGRDAEFGYGLIRF